VLHDTASKNGTYLNGAKIIGPTPIKPGDEVRICNRQFVFLSRTAPANPPAAGPITQTLAE
jgi:pSer/pThr/pTyr-binding forkhead associated (FHA) protein